MNKGYERTQAHVVAGQPLPEPISPPGDGWQLLSTIPGNDREGKPVLIWTWCKLEQGQDAEEDLVQ